MGGGERTARAYIGSFTAAGGAGVVTAALGPPRGPTHRGAPPHRAHPPH
ncbi:lactonase family protein, partial [Streptomyces albidoflavus]